VGAADEGSPSSDVVSTINGNSATKWKKRSSEARIRPTKDLFGTLVRKPCTKRIES
jgi:hypothetical protein